MNRVIAYVDGFNLYFGLRSKGWKRYYWIDVPVLIRNLLKFNQELVMVKYFTARVIESPEKEKRQSTYIEALETLSNLEIFYGKYQLNPRKCPKCGFEDLVPNEKMTDVNIAVEMFSDAVKDKFDIALLLSADSDLKPAIEAIKNTRSRKRIVVVFPPGRASDELTKVAHAYLTIGRAKLAQSLLPPKIRKEDGHILTCPSSWR